MGVSTDAVLFYGYCWDDEAPSPWEDDADGNEDADENATDWETRYARLKGCLPPKHAVPRSRGRADAREQLRLDAERLQPCRASDHRPARGVLGGEGEDRREVTVRRRRALLRLVPDALRGRENVRNDQSPRRSKQDHEADRESLLGSSAQGVLCGDGDQDRQQEARLVVGERLERVAPMLSLERLTLTFELARAVDARDPSALGRQEHRCPN